MTRQRGKIFVLSVLSVVVIAALAAGVAGCASEMPSYISLVGRDSLFNRGMNSALTIYQQYVYIGNRTDSSNSSKKYSDL